MRQREERRMKITSGTGDEWHIVKILTYSWWDCKKLYFYGASDNVPVRLRTKGSVGNTAAALQWIVMVSEPAANRASQVKDDDQHIEAHTRGQADNSQRRSSPSVTAQPGVDQIRAGDDAQSSRLLHRPVVAGERMDIVVVLQIAGHQREVMGQRGRGNQEIERPIGDWPLALS